MTGRFLVGTAGWSYGDWAGRVYPDPPPRGFDGLRHLARFLDCIEINSTFYRVPSPRTAADWVRRTDGLPGFRFTAKVHRSFTHGDESETGPAGVRAFLDALAPLRESGRLGTLLLQFPWSFRDSPDARRRLARLCELFSAERVAVEVRHASFASPDAEAFLAALGAGIAEVDMPASPTNLGPRRRVLGPFGYFRLHGRNAAAWFDPAAGRDRRFDYFYSGEEIDALAGRVRAAAPILPLVFVVTNNHFRGQGPANSLMLRARLLGGPVPVPPELLRAFPSLRPYADPRSPGPGVQELLFE